MPGNDLDIAIFFYCTIYVPGHSYMPGSPVFMLPIYLLEAQLALHCELNVIADVFSA